MHRRRLWMETAIWIGTVILWTGSGAADAQQGDEAGPRFGGLIEVSEVLLDVVATDPEGHAVVGLRADDFIVEEDGEAVPITSVSYYTTRYNLDGPIPGAVPEVPASRYFVLFFHDQTRYGYFGTTLLRQQLEAGRQSVRWVEEELAPSDWVAVVSYGVRLRVYQDFTQDREALGQAIRDAVSGRESRGANSRSRRTARREELSILKRLPPARELRRQTTNIYDAMILVSEAMGSVVGRKNLMLFTLGFGERVGNGRFTRPDPRYYPALEAALNDHNVAVYPINLTPAGREPTQSDFLQQLASDTGGYYHEDFVGFMSPLTATSEENHGYYLISYQTEHPAGETGYQRVEVKARNEGLRIRSRTGYRYGS